MTDPAVAEVREWRCTCPVRPLLASYTETGSAHIRVSGRREIPAHYLVSLRGEGMKGHCPACHAWMVLAYDRQTGEIVSRPWEGERPAIHCPKCPGEPNRD